MSGTGERPAPPRDPAPVPAAARTLWPAPSHVLPHFGDRLQSCTSCHLATVNLILLLFVVVCCLERLVLQSGRPILVCGGDTWVTLPPPLFLAGVCVWEGGVCCSWRRPARRRRNTSGSPPCRGGEGASFTLSDRRGGSERRREALASPSSVPLRAGNPRGVSVSPSYPHDSLRDAVTYSRLPPPS